MKQKYFLIPVGALDDVLPEEWIKHLLKEKIFAFRKTSYLINMLNPGDYLCFYIKKVGIGACAQINSRPEVKFVESIPFKYFPYVVNLSEVKEFIQTPVLIDAELRAKLQAFKGHNNKKSWSWFVQGGHEVSACDFELLTHNNILI